MPVLTAHISDAVIQVGIGIHPHEKNRKQRLIVNCEIGFAPTVWPVQTINHCYDYDALYSYLTETVANGPHIELIESLLHDIATFIFKDKRVTRVMVRLSKPDVLANTYGVGVMFGPCSRDTWEGAK